MIGAGTTEKLLPVLVCPPTVTVTRVLPVGTPAGTGAVMLLVAHTDGVVAIPLTFTVLPGNTPDRKLLPLITIEELIAP
jgi:hypothetical protein